MANLFFGFEDIGLAHKEVERDDAVAFVDAFINAVAGDCTFGGSFRVGQGEAVTVIRFSLADGVIDNCVVLGMYREVENSYGVASPSCLQGIANNSVFHDFREVEAVLVVILSLTHRAGELVGRNVLYG